MTITYTAQVATCRHLGCFWKLLFRWKGSIYKLLWLNMLLYIVLFMSFKFIYLYLMTKDQQKMMVTVGQYCHAFEETIPLSFLLGFYVTIVITRWWEQYLCIPWPDSLAVLVSVFLTGQDVRGRVMRRTIMRYANLCLVMTFTMISPFVKRRFPNSQSFVDAGLLLPSEHQRMKELEKRTTHPKHWLPLVWAIAIVARARREGKIADDVSKETIILEINTFRGTCGSLLNYDWISIPLVYPQVVSWAVYTYFATTIVSYQFPLKEDFIENEHVVMILPIFPMLQFFFYMGWLLVAETLANPFGEDDDDFDIGWLIDRNLQVSYCIADEMHNTHPELLKDQYWDDVLPPDLPWNPHTDMDDPDSENNAQKDVMSKDKDNVDKKSSRWLRGSEVPVTFAKAEFISRSLDFGSERVIRVYLPPSISRITFGSRTNRSGLSKGSRPSGDSKHEHLPLKDVLNNVILSEARTQLVQNKQAQSTGEEVVASNSETRVECENEDQIISGIDLKNESDIVTQENFIYNQNRTGNQAIVNPSSRNVLHIDYPDSKNDAAGSASRIDTLSSLGLHLLLSENVLQKLNDMNQEEEENVDISLIELNDDNNLVIKESSKISIDEKVVYGTKSRGSLKSILKSPEELHSCADEISNQEKSLKSMIKTISTPVTFAKKFISDNEEIMKPHSSQTSNEIINQRRTIEFIEKFNEQYSKNIATETQSAFAIEPILPGHVENSTFRLEPDPCDYKSISEPHNVGTSDESQLVSDMLFDHIFNQEMSKSQQENKASDEYASDQRESPSNICVERREVSIDRNLSDTQSISEEEQGCIEGSDAGRRGDFEQSSSGSAPKRDEVLKTTTKYVVDQEIEKVLVLDQTLSRDANTFTCDDKTCIYEVIDEVAYSVIAENDFDVFTEAPPEAAQGEIDWKLPTNVQSLNEAAAMFCGVSLTNVESCSNNSGPGADLEREESERNADTPGELRPSSSSGGSPQVLPVNLSSQVKDSPADDMEEFRNKVEQSLSLKHSLLSPSQPKVSTLVGQLSHLPTVIELPEDVDSSADLS